MSGAKRDLVAELEAFAEAWHAEDEVELSTRESWGHLLMNCDTDFLRAFANLRDGVEAVAGEYDDEKWDRLESPDLDPESPHYELFQRWHAVTDWFSGIDYTESDESG